ncbi:MAG: sigma-54 dependent transcriptional regulator [Candidatus Neomarinimicrobiota bacterium]|jgi:DNA-binding NtrC family response regulator|nr:sigma-54 dependent transcriptional regulator [Candidatus Neomarinimicrobiota bacterium]
MDYKLLIVDDDYAIRSFLEEALKDAGYNIEKADNGLAALKILENKKIDLIISDLKMPEIDGLQLLSKVKEKHQDTGLLLMSAYGTVEDAVQAMKIGAFDFVTKPFSITEIETRVKRFFEFHDLKTENIELKKKISSEEKYTSLVGTSDKMKEVYSRIEMVSKSDVSVLVTGESGTGKELVSREIHRNSLRYNNPYLQINCAAIPENLVESSLFGYEKGAFTGALKTTKGVFQEADTGSLLLDEVTEIPTSMQAKLLRVLQEKSVTKVGSYESQNIDVRIISTSNRNVLKMVEDKDFREDLFYRLNVFPIEIPSLRERMEDLPLLVDHFLTKFSSKYNVEKKVMSSIALDKLYNHAWPGNVRELVNVIERSFLYANANNTISEKNITLESNSSASIKMQSSFDGGSSLEEIEKRAIFATLRKTKNNRTKASKILDISVRTLRNKLNIYKENDMLPSEFILGEELGDKS